MDVTLENPTVARRPRGGRTVDAGDRLIIIVEREFVVGLDEKARLTALGYRNIEVLAPEDDPARRIRTRKPDLIIVSLDRLEPGLIQSLGKECGCGILYVASHRSDRTRLPATARLLVAPFTDRDLNRAITRVLTASTSRL